MKARKRGGNDAPQHRGNGGNPNRSSGGRRRGRGGRGQNSNPSQGNQQSGGGSGGGGGGRRGRKRRKPSPAGFWGDPAKLPTSSADIRMTDDPAAVPRSLGTPPLPGHEQIAVHYFRAVYDRSVATAGALAAAGGLIDPDSLVGDSDPD